MLRFFHIEGYVRANGATADRNSNNRLPDYSGDHQRYKLNTDTVYGDEAFSLEVA